eukprot:2782338-Ditylum_brightwellii.AAC.1
MKLPNAGESQTAIIEFLEAELQSTQQAHSEEPATLNIDVLKLHGELMSKDDDIVLLKSQLESITWSFPTQESLKLQILSFLKQN